MTPLLSDTVPVLSAVAMLGAAFFHMLPESAKLAGKNFGLWTIYGVIGLYLIERFLSPYSHDTSEASDHSHTHEHEGHAHEDHVGHVLFRTEPWSWRRAFRDRGPEELGGESGFSIWN
jgi:membrane protein implicated in regulation of membrane protease activity